MAAAPPILIWQPGGGIPVGPVSNPPVYSQSDVTQLIIGQSYVDVVFGSQQVDTNWVLVACEVFNITDLAPLNIWPGIITNRTTAGFRIQLNGMPDSNNYYLSWAVSGVNVVPMPATTYLFTGPTSGNFGVQKTFTVKLPSSTTLTTPITVTPDDGGAGGSFSPLSVILSSGSATATFTYTAAAYGPATLSVTNSGTLVDPAPIVFTSIAPVYTFTGPSGGVSGVASTNFTVLLAGDATLAVPTTITPHDGGAGGTFTPTTVMLAAGVPVHFTYTPASAGAKTLSVTNDGGLANPANLTYTATVATLADGDTVVTWLDSSGHGHDAAKIGTPIFKVNIVNSKPVVRLRVASSDGFNLASAISGAFPWCAFVVMKQASVTTDDIFSLVGSDANAVPRTPYIHNVAGVGTVFYFDRSLYQTFNAPSIAFHVFTLYAPSGGAEIFNIDGVVQAGTGGAGFANTGDFNKIGYENVTPAYSQGDLAEIVMCQGSTLSGANIQNAEKTLQTKYATPAVPAGSVIDLTTLPGFAGWWKADSL